MRIAIPELSLVILIGPSGAGKSSFAAEHFGRFEVVSSDFCRGLVSNDENSQEATADAFDLVHTIAAKRLERGLLTVVDATNVQPTARKPLVALARRYHVLPVAIVFDLPVGVCVERNRARPDRDFGAHVVKRQAGQLRRSLKHLKADGFRHIFVLKSPEDVAASEVIRQPLWNNKKDLHGPFDIVGDVHGCYDELVELLAKLGYQVSRAEGERAPASPSIVVEPPEGRLAIFVGDLVDRGPNVPDVLRLVMDMVAAGHALCVPGNHDAKLVKALEGRDVQIRHGLEKTLEQLADEPESFRIAVKDFLRGLVSHYVLDAGRLVVAHAGLTEDLQGRGSAKVRDFALFGDTTGETDEHGLPVRGDWAADYRGRALVVYGHTPVADPEFVNNTINIDTGCVFGGRLTALRYPERELVSVPAREVYADSPRPFLAHPEASDSSGHPAAPMLSAQQRLDEILDLRDVIGKRQVTTRLRGRVTIREENATAALEVMSRFAVDPKWLIHLPPTMSPAQTSSQPGLLEHPAEAFAYYRHEGVPAVICEEKHMGSRAVVVICRDQDVAVRRFGVAEEPAGMIYTRTGRRFFTDAGVEAEVLDRLRQAVGAADLWSELETDWLALDTEIMPWSEKAQELIRRQFAAVGSAGTASLAAVRSVLASTASRFDLANGSDPRVQELVAHFDSRGERVRRFVDAYRRYAWPVESVADLRIAPFHVLASEGSVHVDKHHQWHMSLAARLSGSGDEMLIATEFRDVDLTQPESEARATEWWESLTAGGGEGFVVKPRTFVARGRRGLAQPAIKVRGREYLRIVYGPEYTAPEHLERLRERGLSHKRSLALREFALGIEALERFVGYEPLRRVHECVFGVLAMESEPVDPRL